jgi:selenide,water dikinase
MGARPLTAMNILCFPSKDEKPEVLRDILKGGIDKIHEAGAVLVGGHSVEDTEPKYGLSVTGLVHPERFISYAGAVPGDVLVLTKPLGTGVLATAHKAGLLSPELVRRMTEVMKTLNREASEAMKEVGVNAATDITGFGLVGHGLEMAEAGRCCLVFSAGRVPLIHGALDFIRQGLVPEGDYEVRKFCSSRVETGPGIDSFLLDMLFDAQTSGGLLVSVPENRADTYITTLLEEGLVEVAVVGHVEPGDGRVRITP